MLGCFDLDVCFAPRCRSGNRSSIAERRRRPRLPERRCEAWAVSGNASTHSEAATLNARRSRGNVIAQGDPPPSECVSFAAAYLRAAQAYMLISMPTGTSTIFGVFQAILALLAKTGRTPPSRTN